MPGGREGPTLAGARKEIPSVKRPPDVKLRVGLDHLVSSFTFALGDHPVLSTRFVILLFALVMGDPRVAGARG